LTKKEKNKKIALQMYAPYETYAPHYVPLPFGTYYTRVGAQPLTTMYPNPTPVLYPTYSQPTQTCKTPVVVQKPIEQHPPVDFKGLFGKNMLDINPPVWTDPLRELTEGYKNFEEL